MEVTAESEVEAAAVLELALGFGELSWTHSRSICEECAEGKAPSRPPRLDSRSEWDEPEPLTHSFVKQVEHVLVICFLKVKLLSSPNPFTRGDPRFACFGSHSHVHMYVLATRQPKVTWLITELSPSGPGSRTAGLALCGLGTDLFIERTPTLSSASGFVPYPPRSRLNPTP